MADNIQQLADGTTRLVNTADAVEDQILGGPQTPTVAAPRYYGERTMKVPLAAVDTAGGVLSWQNNFGYDIIVNGLIVDVKTQSSGACTVSFGETGTNGTTSSANLIDTLSVAAAGTFDNVTDKGTNGKSRVKVPAGKWITGSVASGASAGLVGNAYLSFYPA